MHKCESSTYIQNVADSNGTVLHFRITTFTSLDLKGSLALCCNCCTVCPRWPWDVSTYSKTSCPTYYYAECLCWAWNVINFELWANHRYDHMRYSFQQKIISEKTKGFDACFTNTGSLLVPRGMTVCLLYLCWVKEYVKFSKNILSVCSGPDSHSRTIAIFLNIFRMKKGTSGENG